MVHQPVTVQTRSLPPGLVAGTRSGHFAITQGISAAYPARPAITTKAATDAPLQAMNLLKGKRNFLHANKLPGLPLFPAASRHLLR